MKTNHKTQEYTSDEHHRHNKKPLEEQTHENNVTFDFFPAGLVPKGGGVVLPVAFGGGACELQDK